MGLAGGLLGAFAMNVFARAAQRVTRGREAVGAAPGRDRVGRGVQPPQADGRSDQDATVRVGTVAFRAVTGHEPGREARPWLGSAAHYAFGATAGLVYALLARRTPVITQAHGVLYGALVWAIADEGLIPALGLSRGPRRLSSGVHLYALAGHFVYGVTLESVRRQAGHLNDAASERR